MWAPRSEPAVSASVSSGQNSTCGDLPADGHGVLRARGARSPAALDSEPSGSEAPELL